MDVENFKDDFRRNGPMVDGIKADEAVTVSIDLRRNLKSGTVNRSPTKVGRNYCSSYHGVPSASRDR